MNKKARLLYICSALMSFAAALLIGLRFFGDTEISFTYVSLCFICAALFLIVGNQFKQNEKK